MADDENKNTNTVEILMEKITKATQTVIAIGVTVASFIFFFMFIFTRIPDGPSRDVIFVIIGYVSSNMNQIVSYYFGSSKSSDDKTKAITNFSNQKS